MLSPLVPHASARTHWKHSHMSSRPLKECRGAAVTSEMDASPRVGW
ncbi:MAG: hypothetical protein OXF06_13755 [Bacteroidetes bacterium]|nr:hypothetical protein [Bacteroidota bacterium]